ncbi:methyl-accepting chemotaxis protein [Chromobacterium piscinae]|uniref:methyl-accepting chemotaxis protein n=1 Tax=Chromobacterium piscinae TaxID=686831 RepID=UPI001E2D432E|nr:methyl-accepting chemotaxis protein [Chromobacterium piscinae]MCD5326749.1 methyl-accepting chemotaxis protein [Chromobacterium piscinae]
MQTYLYVANGLMISLGVLSLIAGPLYRPLSRILSKIKTFSSTLLKCNILNLFKTNSKTLLTDDNYKNEPPAKDNTVVNTEMMSSIDIFQDIADQIHLLALNAAIECARAGESGDNFQKIAQSIHDLDKSSTASVQNIREIIQNLHQLDATIPTVEEVEKSKFDDKRGYSPLFTEINKTLRSQRESIERLQDQVQKINEKTEQLSEYKNQGLAKK